MTLPTLLWGNVLIKPLFTDSTTKSGIKLPDALLTKGNTIKGVVIAIGQGSLSYTGEYIPMTIAIHDTILFKKYEAEEVILDEDKYYVVDQRQVIWKN